MRKTTSNDNWRRIETVIDHYEFDSIAAFARHLGLKRAENLYQIKRGNNNISRRLAGNICRLFPEVSRAWLLTGENGMIRP